MQCVATNCPKKRVPDQNYFTFGCFMGERHQSRALERHLATLGSFDGEALYAGFTAAWHTSISFMVDGSL